jgi:hypothetical protein
MMRAYSTSGLTDYISLGRVHLPSHQTTLEPSVMDDHQVLFEYDGIEILASQQGDRIDVDEPPLG